MNPMFDPKETAQEAGLKYVTDKEPGIRRKRRGKGFTYVIESENAPLKCSKTLLRIKELVIPPAWQDVWICKHPNGHLQVTGFDARKRKQYRYHPRWYEERNSTKYSRMMELGSCLPKLRSQVEEDLKLTGLPRNKVIAAIVRLMLLTQSRIGNSTYAEENESYGLTTLLNKHAEVRGQKVKLSFRGKSGVDHDIAFVDKTLSRIIARCQELPGEELFCYLDDEDNPVDVTSGHVNDYLKEVTGKDFSAKDLRTWGGTCKALELLITFGPAELRKEAHWKKRHLGVIKETALHLKNTVSVCRKYYIHPTVFEADQLGHLHELWKNCRSCKNLTREEKLLMRLLEAQEELTLQKAA